jgi:hypothetical protein
VRSLATSQPFRHNRPIGDIRSTSSRLSLVAVRHRQCTESTPAYVGNRRVRERLTDVSKLKLVAFQRPTCLGRLAVHRNPVGIRPTLGYALRNLSRVRLGVQVKFRSVTAGAALALATVIALPAAAAQMIFSGSGIFGPYISTLLPVEVPGDTFSFSFDLPSPIASNPTTEVTNSKFFLNGAEVADPRKSVTFYSASDGGGFDLTFTSGPGPQPPVISLYAASVVSNLTIVPGTYAFTLDSPTPEAGSGSLTISAVPEPSSWAVMLLGFGGLGALLRRRRGQPALIA